MSPTGWSTVVSGTVIPVSRISPASSLRYAWSRAVGAVLVLDLHQDDRAALVDLARHDDRRQLLEVTAHRGHERRVAAADGGRPRAAAEPAGQARRWSNSAQMYGPGRTIANIPSAATRSRKRPRSSPPAEPELARPGRVRVPGNVRLDRVQAHQPGLPDPVGPVPGMDPEVVQGAGQDAERLAVEQEVALADDELAGLAGVAGLRHRWFFLPLARMGHARRWPAGSPAGHQNRAGAADLQLLTLKPCWLP